MRRGRRGPIYTQGKTDVVNSNTNEVELKGFRTEKVAKSAWGESGSNLSEADTYNIKLINETQQLSTLKLNQLLSFS